ncbi:hypothetical protein BGZ94_007994 [Podila epigama]|nr:hypothetical protein BGZ94_007994 [Podila epigama]
MRLSIASSVATLVACASVAMAQDETCKPLLVNYDPNSNGQYQKCYTGQVYNKALVAAGITPNYTQIITDVCSKAACSSSTLSSATSKYVTACSASIDAEATASGGNVLQLGKNVLEVFFAAPIHAAFCALDPNTKPLPAPAVTPPTYCLSKDIANPTNRFVSQMAIYLTAGSIRSTQDPFFLRNPDIAEVCSDCSKIAFNGTVEHLANNLMPRVAPFYTPEFVQYWDKAVKEYNKLCKTSFVQTWPEGTLNVTVPGVPTGNPTTPTVDVPTNKPTNKPTATAAPGSGAGALKPAGALAVVALVAAALF